MNIGNLALPPSFFFRRPTPTWLAEGRISQAETLSTLQLPRPPSSKDMNNVSEIGCLLGLCCQSLGCTDNCSSLQQIPAQMAAGMLTGGAAESQGPNEVRQVIWRRLIEVKALSAHVPINLATEVSFLPWPSNLSTHDLHCLKGL